MSVSIHVDKATELHKDAVIAMNIMGAQCAQIFTHGPKHNNMNNIDIKALAELSKNHRIYVHSSYMLSLDKPEVVQAQFDTANAIGATGVVIHLKKQPPNYYVERLANIKCGDVKILLEMKAIKPKTRYGYQTPEEINELCEAFVNDARVGICIDTAHLSAGRIALNTTEEVEAYFSKLKYPDMILLCHLNGNAYDPMVRAGDKHVIPTAKGDYVFPSGDGDVAVASWFVSRGRDVIVECDDATDYVNDLCSILNQNLTIKQSKRFNIGK